MTTFKLCPYCRKVEAMRSVGVTGNGAAFVSWACDPCQASVDLAMDRMMGRKA